MSSITGRAAFKATRALRRPSGVNAGDRRTGEPESLLRKITHTDTYNKGERTLRKGAKRDPELYILYAITATTMAGTGWYLPRFAQTLFGEVLEVPQVPESEPWKSNGAKEGKYKFYPYGDPRRGEREAPSAMNTVIVPNVNLPKKLHDIYNKYGKPEWDV
ncbi:hypothetical protein W97_00165 [Coniosporium apollinis CBS 100218]|uniref:Uncharacterized protein n=1 Tax=Coniosporium apollinis (strain CBS 100218) TaxID=1168221 RepID=R7YGD2_CONA1|nr:uncharacterized protein W97_00165 [Coniosporium apollinis CBS 100218]EON60955.1 hypothetical protein W97_00165 [Coniosporium apollinis CBS 100218]